MIDRVFENSISGEIDKALRGVSKFAIKGAGSQLGRARSSTTERVRRGVAARAARHVRMQKKLSRVSLMSLLTGKGTGGGNTVVGKTAVSPFDGRLDAALRGVSRFATKNRREYLAITRTFPTQFYKQKGPFKGPRKDFRDTLYWNPAIITDAFGEAKASFGLNDKVTSFRATCSGIGGGYLGRFEKVITSRRPFFMVVKLPLEVSAGDAMVLPLTLRK